MRRLCLVIALALVAFPAAAWASDGTTVNVGATQDITAFSVCKRITNGASGSLYVPTTSAAEWTSFYNYPPASVTIAACGCAVTPGSQTYSTAGSFSFTVPCYNNLTVEVWGGGGGGSGANDTTPAGTNGGQSKWNGTVIANGGIHAAGPNGAAGGTASGGTTNTTGGSGQSNATSAGGTCPASGPCKGGNGARWCPVTCSATAGGGGSGGYSTKTYAPGQLTVGTGVAVVVGASGTGGKGTAANGAPGGTGRVTITWN